MPCLPLLIWLEQFAIYSVNVSQLDIFHIFQRHNGIVDHENLYLYTSVQRKYYEFMLMLYGYYVVSGESHFLSKGADAPKW